MAAAIPSTAGGLSVGAGSVGGGGAGSTSFASASLYVGDLALDVTEALLFEIFNAVGPVASVRVCRDAATRRSLGYAYVNFHRVDDAERALDTMNFKPIRGRPCRIMWSHRDPSLRRSGVGNVFVNHLAKSIDNKSLFDTFSLFGNILSCKVATNSKRESLGYGFVHYESDEAAQTAIAKVDGKVIAGEKVSVSLFKSKKERGANKFKYTNVFIKNLPGDITKEQLESLFGKHGNVTSSMITQDKDNKSRAFGFVNFAAPEEASVAVDKLHNSEFQGRQLFVSRAQKKEEREKELRDKFEQLRTERQKKYAGVNLYVKNLSEEIDDQRITLEFSKFGNITSAKVMRDKPDPNAPVANGANPLVGKSRGFGFVCFSSPEEATKAVTEMNGRMLDGKPLYVALAQRKEVRRAQLEAQYNQRAKLGLPGPNGAGVGLGGPMPQMGYPALPPQMFNMPPGMSAAAGQRGFPLYQQQVLPRWNPGTGGPMMNAAAMNAAAMRGPPLNYQLMPAGMNVNPRGVPVTAGAPGVPPAGAQAAGRVNPAGRSGPRNPRNGAPQQAGAAGAPAAGKVGPYAGQPGAQPNANIRYAENVRNRGAAGVTLLPTGGAPVMQQQEQVVMPAPNEPLTIKALAAAPEEMRKQMIGERLFPLIKLQEPALAGKITGMLLEMDNGELIHLLESQQALQEKIQEALQVLHQHPGIEETAEEK